MKRPAKKGVSKDIIEVIAGGVIGVVAGVAAMFFSRPENREMVARKASAVVKKGKAGIAVAKKRVVAVEKKLLKKKR